MRLCINTGYDYSVPVMESLGLVAEAGYETVCFGMNAGHSQYWDRAKRPALRERLDAVGLALHCIHAWSVLTPEALASDDAASQAGEHLRVCVAACAELGAPFLVLHTAGADASPETLARQRGILEGLAPALEPAGVTLALENLGPGHEEVLADLLETLDASSVGFCYDSSHAFRVGDVLGILKRFRDRLVITHLSDRSEAVGREHLLPGDGELPWPEIMAILSGVDLHGVVFTELSRDWSVKPYDTPLAYLTEAYRRGTWLAGMIEAEV